MAVGLEQNLLVEDAHTADLLLMQQRRCMVRVDTRTGGSASQRVSRPFPASLRRCDEIRRIAVATGAQADACRSALDRGALGCAAQALGLAQRMVDLAVQLQR